MLSGAVCHAPWPVALSDALPSVSLRREQALYAPSLRSHAAPWCPGAFASLLLFRGELRYKEVGVNGTVSSFISPDNCRW